MRCDKDNKCQDEGWETIVVSVLSNFLNQIMHWRKYMLNWLSSVFKFSSFSMDFKSLVE